MEKSDAVLCSGVPSTNRCEQLPPWASPIPPAITEEDIKFLQLEGALEVPDGNVRSELLRNYVQFVHPVVPVLDLEGFLTVFNGSHNSSLGVSFLLFQAVIFAATAFETAESLSLEGFRDRREARRIRFERVKMLYSVGCENDRMTVLQTALLMTHWDDDSNEDAWHFVGIAKELWQSIETNPTTLESRVVHYQKGLWNRISWSCYTRDRLVALRMRRSPQIDQAEFKRPALRLSDFEISPLSTKCCLGDHGSHPAIRDPSARKLLSQVMILLAEYCTCITRIIECQYTVSVYRGAPDNTSSQSLVPRQPRATNAEVLLRDGELADWHNSIPEPIRLLSSGFLQRNKRHGDVMLYFGGFLNGIYNLALSTLHRPQLIPTSCEIPELVELSTSRARDAAFTITEAYITCKKYNQDLIMSDLQVTMMESAITTHFTELEAANSSVRQRAIQNFQTCAQALRHLADTYPSADAALAFLDVAVRNKTSSAQGNPLNGHRVHESAWENTNRLRSGSQDISSPENNLFPTISQQIERLNPPQTSKLLCSHFMMTSSEKAFLRDLICLEDCTPEISSEEDSSESISHGSTPPQPQAFPMPDLPVTGGAQNDIIERSINGTRTLECSGDADMFATVASSPNDKLEAYWQNDEQIDDWELFQMLSQYCTE